MRKFAETAEAIAATTKKLQKTALVAEYLKSRPTDQAAASAIFLSGRAFPAWEETTLQFGGRLLWRVVAELSSQTESALTAAYRKHGDLGAVAGDVLPERAGQGLRILEVAETFEQIATARGPAAKAALVRDLLGRATPLEAKYIVKIMTGDLRIGLKESLVEEAIAKAYLEAPAAQLLNATKDGAIKDGALKEVHTDCAFLQAFVVPLQAVANNVRQKLLASLARLKNGTAQDRVQFTKDRGSFSSFDCARITINSLAPNLLCY